MVYFDAADVFVFLCTPTLQALDASTLTLLDIPVVSRMLDLPANFRITAVPIGPTTLQGQAEKSVLSLPSRQTLTTASKPADIMLLRIEKQSSTGSQSGGVDMSSPVQKILAALQSLRNQIAPDLREQIDSIMREVCPPLSQISPLCLFNLSPPPPLCLFNLSPPALSCFFIICPPLFLVSLTSPLPLFLVPLTSSPSLFLVSRTSSLFIMRATY